MLVSENWPRFILPIIRKEWEQAMAATPSPAFQFYDIQTSRFASEYSQGIGGSGLVPEYNSKPTGGEGSGDGIEYDDFSALFESTFTHKEYAKGIIIERKLIDDNASGIIKRRAQGLGTSFGSTRATHASSLFVNAFSSSVVGGDAKALCATDHPKSKENTSTFSNKGTTALGLQAIIDTIVAGQQMTDDKDVIMPVIYDVLYVPVGLQAAAFEYARSLNKPDTADNNANWVAAQGLSVVVDPYLTSQSNWFMLSSVQAKLHMIWYNRVLPDIAVDPSSDYNLKAKYRGYMRYSWGWDDARFIYGHQVG